MKKSILGYFTRAELGLWLASVAIILGAFLIFDGEGYLSLIASLLGATSLIFIAKGNPIGQVIIIVFCTLYAIISFSYAYYGELLTYLCMTLPMAVVSLIFWLKNPYKDSFAEVKVNRLSKREICFALLLTGIVTTVFYFLLAYFNTANLVPSTLSVATSFFAAYLTFRRSPYYALAYAANDIVLIVLWALATVEDISYISVLACFVVFLFNDIYGFYSWRKMQKRQNAGA